MQIKQKVIGELYQFTTSELNHKYSFSHPAFVDEMAALCENMECLLFDSNPTQVTILIFEHPRTAKRDIKKFIIEYFTKQPIGYA